MSSVPLSNSAQAKKTVTVKLEKEPQGSFFY